jgi:hypothetical protein
MCKPGMHGGACFTMIYFLGQISRALGPPPNAAPCPERGSAAKTSQLLLAMPSHAVRSLLAGARQARHDRCQSPRGLMLWLALQLAGKTNRDPSS